jgi:hypothetical protein
MCFYFADSCAQVGMCSAHYEHGNDAQKQGVLAFTKGVGSTKDPLYQIQGCQAIGEEGQGFLREGQG